MDPDFLRQGITLWLILVASLSVHEWAHAITAYKLGDHTAHSEGRVTLNPVAHIDPIGTILIPLFMILMSPGFALIGWGKPVPVDSRNFRNKMRDDLLVTMAGPLSNLVICIVMVVIGILVFRFAPHFQQLVVQVILLNSVLIVFNMIPIPPLDGSHVMRYVVGMRDETYYALSRWGFIILIVLINIPQFRQGFSYAIWTLAGIFLSIIQMVA